MSGVGVAWCTRTRSGVWWVGVLGVGVLGCWGVGWAGRSILRVD